MKEIEEEMGRKGRSTQGRERKRKAEEIRAICKARRNKRKGKRKGCVVRIGCRGGRGQPSVIPIQQ
jgi:hypothetical protein